MRSITTFSTAPLFASVEPGRRVVTRVAEARDAAATTTAPFDAPRARDAAARAAEVERLYREHKDFVHRLALRYGSGRRAWAEDVTHDVFVGLFDALDELVDHDDLRGFLYRATTNRCLSKLRRDKLRALAPVRWLVGDPAPDTIAPEAGLEAREELRQLVAALDELDPKERVAFSMYYADGLEQEAIGAAIGCSKSYVCKLIQRAVKKLEQRGWEVRDAT